MFLNRYYASTMVVDAIMWCTYDNKPFSLDNVKKTCPSVPNKSSPVLQMLKHSLPEENARYRDVSQPEFQQIRELKEAQEKLWDSLRIRVQKRVESGEVISLEM